MGKNELDLIPTYWASVSGGKDSLLMMKIIFDNPDKYKLDGVIHFELEIDYPFVQDVIKSIETECKKRNVKFVKIKPRTSWFELYDKMGFPTRKVRWCNRQYKLDASKQLIEYEKSLGHSVVYYIGYCKDEFNRYDKRKNLNEIYPLVDFSIIEDDVLRWARNVPVFNDYYKSNKRCGCMWCPMASRINLAYLYKHYPNKYDELMRRAKETEIRREEELGRPFSVWDTNIKYNTDYMDNIVKTKWLDILNIKEGD